MLRKIRKFFSMSSVERRYRFLSTFIPKRISSTLFTNYLTEKGVQIGKGTIFHDPQHTTVDTQRGWMVRIGEYCKITSGVTILAHDYSRSVLRRKYGEIIGEGGCTTIGDNVFLGINSIILMGARIGSNCVVGAGSVVSGCFPDDVVIAGNPARVIMPLQQLYEKRKASCIDSGKMYCREFYNRFHRPPKPSEMSAFFSLFLERSKEAIEKNEIWIAWNGDDKEEILESFLCSAASFNSYEDFINASINEVQNED